MGGGGGAGVSNDWCINITSKTSEKRRPATMNQTHHVIGTCAAHISWNLRSRDSEVD